MSIKIGFDPEKGEAYVFSEFDRRELPAELSEFEKNAVSIIQTKFEAENIPFETAILLKRNSTNYLSLVLSNGNDFCRIKAGARSTWVSLDMWRCFELQSDPRLNSVKNKNQRHWKIILSSVDDINDISDLVVSVYKTIKSLPQPYGLGG